MSAKDAPGEVNKDKVFDSSSSSSEDDEIIYRAADIKKKPKTEFFVNVEGAEARAKAAAKREEEEKKALERAEKELEKEAKAEQAAAEKKLVEEKKKIDEVTAYVKKQKRAKEKAINKEKNKKRNSRIAIISAVSVGIIAIIVAIVVAVINLIIIPEQERLAKEKEQRESNARVMAQYLAVPYHAIIYEMDKDEKLFEAVENYHFDDVRRIYDEYLADVTDNETKAYVYLNMAERIGEHTTDEYDEMIEAVKTALIYAPNDTYILTRLHDYYVAIDDREHANEVTQTINDVLGEAPTEQQLKADQGEEWGEG